MASTKKLLNLISEFGKHAIQEQYAKIIYIPIYQQQLEIEFLKYLQQQQETLDRDESDKIYKICTLKTQNNAERNQRSK